VAGTIGTWALLRWLLFWVGGAGLGVAMLSGRYLPDPALPWPRPAPVPAFEAAVPLPPLPPSRTGPGRPAPAPASFVAPPTGAPPRPGQLLRLALAPYLPDHPARLLRAARYLAETRPADAAPLPSEALSRPAGRSRWSGSAYLFARPGSGAASLAAGGELGGSQAAARLSYRLNPDGPVRTAAAARLYAPLGQKGAEAAVGLDWFPVGGVPVRVSVERRFDLDGHGRSAWSAYAAGGFYLERLNGTVSVDGYAQAGVVGVERRDLFVDGAVRVGRRWHLGGATVTAGAGLWGAAQPEVARLDVGPRLAATLPVDAHSVTLAVEGRLRVAGDAHPGSGAALTLAVDL
jgi:hypothetical protein